MLEKLTKDRMLDRKMQKQILGGGDCATQCSDDCGDPIVLANQHGDVDGKRTWEPPVIVKLR